MSNLDNVPITSSTGGDQILGGIANITRDDTAAVISHYAIAPAYDVFATTQGRDLGRRGQRWRRPGINAILKTTAKDLPKGAVVTLRGQVQTMNSAYSGLLFGLAGTIVLIYLIVVAQFPILAGPVRHHHGVAGGARTGIVWMLFSTQTPLSVSALTGADHVHWAWQRPTSILVVSFCREQLEITGDPIQAQRSRPASRASGPC